MKEIVSVPQSLRQQLEQVDNLLTKSQNAALRANHNTAEIHIANAMDVLRDIAVKHPEIAAGLLAKTLGASNLEVFTRETKDTCSVVEKKFLGLHMGYEVVPTTTTTSTYKRVRIY